ncbi:uncharacterized protein BJ171DRAFT_493034 [Polychytrium aggregatum]|uniref:uncharacterized protein n=1 Tax=Polychytrium aggregatum TaxID=110093 RepID=UPI0022FE402F|nr:uncharacterized protein BJ171DRAFT_493034 [Polychytrium aggregatum]KAI9207570.1 hypothetical protein BJ171DRAFT_493034 [Polychytrium aggregatum]
MASRRGRQRSATVGQETFKNKTEDSDSGFHALSKGGGCTLVEKDESAFMAAPTSPSMAPKKLGRFVGLENLNSALANRPDKQTLIDRNVLKPDNVSAKLQGAQEMLKKQIIEDNLRGKIAARPDKNTLLEHHILKDGEAANATQAASQQPEAAQKQLPGQAKQTPVGV